MKNIKKANHSQETTFLTKHAPCHLIISIWSKPTSFVQVQRRTGEAPCFPRTHTSRAHPPLHTRPPAHTHPHARSRAHAPAGFPQDFSTPKRQAPSFPAPRLPPFSVAEPFTAVGLPSPSQSPSPSRGFLRPRGTLHRRGAFFVLAEPFTAVGHPSPSQSPSPPWGVLRPRGALHRRGASFVLAEPFTVAGFLRPRGALHRRGASFALAEPFTVAGLPSPSRNPSPSRGFLHPRGTSFTGGDSEEEAKNLPVRLFRFRQISSGVPVATIRPP